MKTVYLKKTKRKCGVRGCQNTVSFAVSRTREIGNSVVICAECARLITEALPEYEKTPHRKKFLNAPPPLFCGTPAEAEEETTGSTLQPTAQDGLFVCRFCGKEYKTEKGAITHMASCLTDKTRGGEQE